MNFVETARANWQFQWKFLYLKTEELLLLGCVSYFVMFYMPERRQAEAARIRDKYPDRIPVWMSNTVCVCACVFSFSHWVYNMIGYGVGDCGEGRKKWCTWNWQKEVRYPLLFVGWLGFLFILYAFD